jgi:trk system potassium uptake protein TrkH
MKRLINNLSFAVELCLNGIFLLTYSLKDTPRFIEYMTQQNIDLIIRTGTFGVPIVIAFVIMDNFRQSQGLEDFFRKYVFSLVVFVPMIVTIGEPEFMYWLGTVHLFSSALALVDVKEKKEVQKSSGNLLDRLKLKPAQFVLITFGAFIVLGSLLLVLPVSAAPGKAITFIDAIFTATSAICVTGLSTISLDDNFSLFGQLVVLFLIQVGGLGIMTLYSSMTLLLGRSMGMKEQVRMQGILDISSMEDLVAMIVDIVKYTLIIELWGAVILTIAFSFEGYEFGEALYYGFFHSISAFCNAGFALFNNSLENFSTNPLISGTIMILIILGGLGFIVLKECKAAIIERKSFILLSVHTRIVLITTAALIFLGTTVLFFSEFLHAFNDYSIFDKVLVSLFHSVTARTAGFNTIGLNSFHAHSLYLISLFMFIGASPGSTGGGIKTSTFAILVQSVRSTLRGRKDVEFFDRRIPSSLVVSSTAIIIISLTIVSFFLLVMMKIETEHSFITLFFEVISAFATTGLSLGITPYLTSAGKFIIVMLMFVGRVGPLTLALAIGQKSSIEGNLEYPESRVMIG